MRKSSAICSLIVLVMTIALCLSAKIPSSAETLNSDAGKAVDVTSQKPAENVPGSIDEKPLLDSIDKLMDDKLAPLYQKQAILEKLLLEDKFSGPKMTDIVGGIGWILGLAGIAAFFWSSRRSPRSK